MVTTCAPNSRLRDGEGVLGFVARAEALVGDAVGQGETASVVQADADRRAAGEQQGVELRRAPQSREVVQHEHHVVAAGAKLRAKGGHLGQGRGP